MDEIQGTCAVCGLRLGAVTPETDWMAWLELGNAKTGWFEDRPTGDCPACGRQVEVCPCGDPMPCECPEQDDLSLDLWWEVVPFEVFRPKTDAE